MDCCCFIFRTITELLVGKIVKEEAAAAVGQQNTDAGSSKEKLVKTNGTSPGNKWSSSVATHLNGLLTKIRQKGYKGDQIEKKPWNLEVHYIRIIDDEKYYVAQKYGGGKKFVSLDNTNNDITFKRLLDKAIDLFFSNRKHFHGEYTKDVNILLLDSEETIVDQLDNVSEYLKSRKLFPSKTWFFLQSSELLKPSNYDFNMSDSEEVPELFITSAINTRKRKICPIYASTLYASTEVYCLCCEKNVEFNKTVAIDREKATSTNSKKKKFKFFRFRFSK